MKSHLQHLTEALEGQHRCLECRNILDPFQLFCMKCGSENLEFSEDALEEEYRTRSILEVRNSECPEYHTVSTSEATHETKEEILEHLRGCPFCPHCGVNIWKIAIH